MVKLYLFCLLGFVLGLSTQTNAQNAPRRYIDYLGLPTIRTYNIPFGQSVDENGVLQTQKLDIYELRGDVLAARPAIILIHGGNFTGGDKEHVALYANEFVKRGYLAVLVNHRVSKKNFKNEITDPDFVAAADNAKEDVLGAIRWLRANATQWRVDKGRIGVFGFSSGASIALSINANQTSQSYENDADPSQSMAISSIIELVGLADPASIAPGNKPVLMIHGETDTGIKREYVMSIYQTFKDNNVPVKLKFSPGSHDMAPYIGEIGPMTSAWFKSFLVDAQPVY
ncbi:hypothetical protein GCM10027299_41500 [Larkinella ripae]